MNRIKTQLKALTASNRIFKEESKRILQENDGIHTLECYDYQEEKSKTRAFSLFYGYLRGKSYEEIEQRAYRQPDWPLFRKFALRSKVRTPYFRDCKLKKKDLYEGVPRKLKFHICNKLEEGWDHPEVDHPMDLYWNNTDREWVQLVREVYSDEKMPPNLDSYIKMEEWIQEARSHLDSQ